jgi:hypothetical protein
MKFLCGLWPDKEFDKNFLFQNMEKSSTKKKEIPREIANCHDIFPETNFITLILRLAIYTREKSITHGWLSRLIWPLAKDGIRKKFEIHIMDKFFIPSIMSLPSQEPFYCFLDRDTSPGSACN